MSSTSLAYVADLHLHFATVLAVMFLHWWTIWFVLGRNFSTTTLMLFASRGLTLTALFLVLLSGAIGDSTVAEFSFAELALASALLFVIFYLSDILLLKTIMRRVREGFTWKRHDLISFVVANFIYVAAVFAKSISRIISDTS
jgi:hypothetical protein